MQHAKSRQVATFLVIFFILMAVFIAWDIWTDIQSGGSTPHILVETVLLSFNLVAFIYSIRRLNYYRKSAFKLSNMVQDLTEEKKSWQMQTQSLLKGLSEKIALQFQTWVLTKAETEVGFLLLKGFSLKEIADLRGTKLKTVQLQAQSIYHKTQLANRSELSAFFLEDLLPPL